MRVTPILVGNSLSIAFISEYHFNGRDVTKSGKISIGYFSLQCNINIGASRSEPQTNLSYDKIAVPMYVCMYVCMYVLYMYVCLYVCSDTSSTCSSCTMRVRAHITDDSVEIVNVDSMLTLIVAHPAGELRNSSKNSQRVRAGRDLENSLLKGRRSRLYKQHTSLQSAATMIIVSIITDSIPEVLSSLGCTESVLGLVLACATQFH